MLVVFLLFFCTVAELYCRAGNPPIEEMKVGPLTYMYMYMYFGLVMDYFTKLPRIHALTHNNVLVCMDKYYIGCNDTKF